MTAVLDDPFAEEIERRDRWGRPLLVPPGGGERQPYTRMSTMSGYLCDKSALETWTRQKLAIGLSRREDLCALIASLPVIHDCFTDKSLLTKEQKKSDVETKARLAEYMEAAMEAGDRLYKANWGTAIHAFIERGVWDSAPQRMIADVQAALKMFADHKLEVLATERFVVNDALQAAGTFDYLVRHPKYGCCIADVKGLPLDTPLPTPTGWTTMSEVQVGDELLSQDGKPCTVLTKSQVHHNPCVRVHFDDGTSAICDVDHRWAVRRHDRTGAIDDVVTAAEMQRWMAQKKPNEHMGVLTPGALELPPVDLPIDPYVLGAWLGDGKHTSGEIAKGDAWLFEEIERRGYRVGADISSEDRCEAHTVLGLRTQLRQAGLLGNKYIPDGYLRASREQRLALLQGLMDTDGGWNKARHQASFSAVNLPLARQVHELALSLGQRATYTTAPYSGFGVTGVAARVNFSPRDLNPFRMPRKRDQVTYRAMSRAHRRLVTKIEDTLLVPTQCIEVDSSNHTYLCTRDFIPTHNTGQMDGHGLEFGVQFSGYAGGVLYDWETDERTPLESLTGGEPVNQDVGLLIHVPLGQARTALYPINLVRGRQAAQLAVQVREERSYKEFIGPELVAS
jgi:hypothetical protein